MTVLHQGYESFLFTRFVFTVLYKWIKRLVYWEEGIKLHKILHSKKINTHCAILNTVYPPVTPTW